MKLKSIPNSYPELLNLTACWEHFPLSKYNLTLHLDRLSALPVITSMGCPKHYDFCCIPRLWNRQVIMRPPAIVVAEIKRNIKKFAVNRFHLYDDDFLLSAHHVTALCSAILDEKLDIRFIFESSVKSILRNRELLPVLKQAGCIGIELGGS